MLKLFLLRCAILRGITVVLLRRLDVKGNLVLEYCCYPLTDVPSPFCVLSLGHATC
jgi:hypothetical protein